MNINDFKSKFEEIKKRLIQEGSKPGAEEGVKKNFWHYFKKNQSHLSISGQIEKIYDLLTSGNLSTTDKALIVGTLAYFINPFDIIPDMIPFVGFVDDLTIIALVYRYLTNRAIEETSNNEDNKKPSEDSDHS